MYSFCYNSAAIAKSLGCDVVTFSSQNIQNEYIQQAIRNDCWSHIKSGWVLALDMDEWLCITEQELEREYEQGTTIITVKGVNMIGDSQTVDLSDIDLHAITKGVDHHQESKTLCFLRDKIEKMDYVRGGHSCSPIGEIVHSANPYINKHMDLLGLPFLINKMQSRYERTHLMRSHGMDGHYTDNVAQITQRYNDNFNR